jgi:hypothetical protein
MKGSIMPITERTDLPLDVREIEYHFAYIRAAIAGKIVVARAAGASASTVPSPSSVRPAI